MPENYNRHGETKWTNDQALIGICNNCQYFEEQQRISTHFLNDFSTEISNAYESLSDKMDYLESIGEDPNLEINKVIKSHSNTVLPYLHKQFDKSIMALSGKSYQITNPSNGDGYNCIKVHWRNDLKLLDEYILDEYDVDFE